MSSSLIKAGLAALAFSLAASTAFAADTVRVALVTGTSSIAIAEANGFFEKYDLEVEITDLATGTETIAAVFGGSADVAYADTFAGVNAIHNGFDIRLVAGANHTSQSVNYLVRADSDIQTLEDIKGRNLGLGAVPFFRVFANKLLQSNGIEPSEVQFTLIRQTPALAETLENGAVDVIQSNGFQVTYGNDGVGEGYNFRAIVDPRTASYQNPEAVQAGWWTSKEVADSKGEVLARFAAAYREFSAWHNALDAEARAALVLEHNRIDYHELAAGDPEKLNNLAFLSTARYVEGPVDIEATQEWIASGVEAAPDQVLANIAISDYLLDSAR